jgi:hypothetical protein
MNIAGGDFYPDWQQIAVLDTETRDVKSIKFHNSNCLVITGLKSSLPLTYVGIIRIQIAQRTGVIQPVLRAIEPVKGNTKGNPKGNVKGKGSSRGTGRLGRDGISQRVGFSR